MELLPELAARPSANAITSLAQYDALSTEGGGFGQAGCLMKFFIDARKRVYFINANYQKRGETPD